MCQSTSRQGGEGGAVPPFSQPGGTDTPFPGQEGVTNFPGQDGWGTPIPGQDGGGGGQYLFPGQDGVPAYQVRMEGTPFPGQDRGGYPHPRSGQGRAGGSTPFPGQDGGYPFPRSGWGYPLSRSGWGYPIVGQDGGTRCQDWMGVSPRREIGR